jgi:hypothetical protein
MKDQETPGMARYKKSKFLDMMRDEASNPTESEMAPYTGEKSQVQDEIRGAEEGFSTAAYENMRMLDNEPKQYDFGAEDPRGNAIEAGRTPQSLGLPDFSDFMKDVGTNQPQQEAPAQVPMAPNNSNQYMNQAMQGLTPPSNNQLPSTQANQNATQQAMPAFNNEIPSNFTHGALGSAPMEKKPGTDFAITPSTPIQKAHAEHIDEVTQKVSGLAKQAPVTSSTPEWEKTWKTIADLNNGIAKSLQDGNIDIAKQKQAEATKLQNRLQEVADMEKATKDKYVSDINAIDDHVNRTRLMDDMPLGNKLIAAASLFAGAFARTGQSRALASLQSEIDKDVQNQKVEYDRKMDKAKNAYAIAAKFEEGEKERLKLAHAITAESLASKMDELNAGVYTDKVKVSNEMLKNQLRDSYNKNLMDNYMNRLKINSSLLSQANTRQTMQERALAIKEKVGEKVITGPRGEMLGSTTTKKEAEDTRNIMAKVEDAKESIMKAKEAVKGISGTTRALKTASAVLPWVHLEENRTDWQNATSKTQQAVLDFAIAKGRSNRMSVSEINKLTEQTGNMFKHYSTLGPDALVDFMDNLDSSVDNIIDEQLKAQNVKTPVRAQTTFRER